MSRLSFCFILLLFLGCEKKPVNAENHLIACDDITRFDSRCDPSGNLMTVASANREFDGNFVTFEIAGLEITQSICNTSALNEICCFEPGEYTISLLDPPGCYAPITVVCPTPPVIIGGCCHPDGSCTETKQEACVGTYQGDNTVCSPNNCPQPTSPESRYWVGVGNWNDPANWSTESGGTGGASIPTSDNDVVFDGEAGTATLSALSFCKSLTINPGTIIILDLNEHKLTMAEDCILQSGVLNQGTGSSILSVGGNLNTVGCDISNNAGRLNIEMTGSGMWSYDFINSPRTSPEIRDFTCGQNGNITILQPVGDLTGLGHDLNLRTLHLGTGSLNQDISLMTGTAKRVNLELHSSTNEVDITSAGGTINLEAIEHEGQGLGPFFIQGNVNFGVPFSIYDVTGAHNNAAREWKLNTDLNINAGNMVIEKRTILDLNNHNLSVAGWFRSTSGNPAGKSVIRGGVGNFNVGNYFRIANTDMDLESCNMSANHIRGEGNATLTGANGSAMTLTGNAPDSPTKFYIATSGHDLNTGTQASPWATFERAEGALAAGVTCYFNSGDTFNISNGFNFNAVGGNIGSYGTGVLPVFQFSDGDSINLGGGNWRIYGVKFQWGDNSTPIIAASRTSGVAPLGVFFDVSEDFSGVIQPPIAGGVKEYFKFHYTWNFGDGSAPMYGHLAAHVFSVPGEYTVILSVKDTANIVHNYQETVTVSDPEVWFAGRTSYVAADGNDLNDGSITNPYRSWSRGIESLGENGPRRVLFRSGDIFSTMGANISDFVGPLYIGSYGEGGALPVVFGTGVNELLQCGSGNDLAVYDISFLGEYNPVTGMGTKPKVLSFQHFNGYLTFYNNSFSNLGLFAHIGQLGETSDTVISNNTITAWHDYGILTGDLLRVAIINNSIKQDVNAQTGDGKLSSGVQPDLPDHGPIRLRAVRKVLVSGNDLFSNTGWSAGHDPNGIGHQPCLRIGTGGIAENCIVSGNLMEGGHQVAISLPSNSSAQARLGTVIWENNLLIATDTTRKFQEIELGGAVIRNNLYLRPNVDPFPNERMLCAICFAAIRNPTPGTLIAHNHIFGNSYVSLASGLTEGKEAASFLNVAPASINNMNFHNNLMFAEDALQGRPFITWLNGLEDFTSNCNLYFAPNTVDFIELPSGDINLDAWRVLSGNDTGSIWQSNPSLVDPINGNFRLRFDSPAVDTGCDVPLNDDFDRSMRVLPFDIGAFEFKK